MPPTDDSTLVAAIRAGDVSRFRELVARYDARVRLVVAYRLEDTAMREDAVQETFYKAFKYLDRLARPERFEAWLVRIARTVAADHRRRRTRRDVVFLEELEGVSTRATLDWIWDEVQELVPAFAQVLSMRYREGCSYAEIAERLGVPLSTVRGRIYEARRALRHRLTKDGQRWW
ncbi:MAG: sigma-70 family RNA polymerase sigma factor [bacterium]|nr:sigma-70 family RNA polymerase sigma factor [bacterium]